MPPTARPLVQPQRLRQLLRKMVDIYSPSGKEEELASFLHGYLRRHGLPVVRQEVDEDRDNLVVEPDDTRADLMFVGHIDTVVAYDLDQYFSREQDDEVFGLGTADMKGGCAAMIEAMLTLWENGRQDLPVGLALVVGEEERGDGTQRLVRDFNFSRAVVGEPTDLAPCLSHWGYLEMQLTTRGKRMHASLAPLGQNAIEAMLHLLLAYTHHLDGLKPDAVYNVRDLASSKSGFAVPDRCEAWMDLHLPPLADMGHMTGQLEELLEKQRGEKPLEASIDFNTIHDGYQIPEKGQFVNTLRAAYKKNGMAFKQSSFRSHSDANILWAAGVKPVLIGPGMLEKAHAPEESVSFGQVAKAAQLYVDIALGCK